MKKKIHVIGAGFSGIAVASCLAHLGHDVTILEKNNVSGGRASQLKENGFTFDMGPSWYWMPDVFESYFSRFGKKPSDYYKLIQLSPSYQVVLDNGQYMNIPKKYQALKQLFDSIEPGAGEKLDKFMDDAAYKYKVGINNLVYKPCHTFTEFISYQLLLDSMKLNIFSSMRAHVRQFFNHPHLLQLMEFPILFLGAKPSNTPALYSLMNYADAKLGTWYPHGGMYEVVKGMTKLAKELGVVIKYNEQVEGFDFDDKKIKKIKTNVMHYNTDCVVGSADYHHIEMKLLPKKLQQYSQQYWESRTLAPGALMFFLGFSEKIQHLEHHTMFFDENFDEHAKAIYESKTWTKSPLFYVNMASKTDENVAPKGCDNMVILIPVAPGLNSNESQREYYYNLVMDRIEKKVGESIRGKVVFKKSYAHEEFIEDYNAYKGNAYGLANTISQTAIFKPKLKSKKVSNLYYTGQMTVPGPGVPPAIISGQVAAQEIKKDFPTG